MAKMRLPDYIIVGAQRCGSTSLHNWLRAHPDVAAVGHPLREMAFFAYPRYYKRGVAWYANWFKDVAPGMLVGEKSPLYFDHLLVPKRVRAACPAVKLIVVLRNPVDRAYSHYWKAVAKGFETLPFARALQAEACRLAGERAQGLPFWREGYYLSHHHVRAYFLRGRYVAHLRRWFASFPRSQICIVKSEDLFSKNAGELRRVENFLGLKAVAPRRFPRWQGGKYPVMDMRQRGRLTAAYSTYNKRLAKLLGDNKWLWNEEGGN